MVDARELMDRLTAAATGAADPEALGGCLAEDVPGPPRTSPNRGGARPRWTTSPT